jgi:hypothetical protein
VLFGLKGGIQVLPLDKEGGPGRSPGSEGVRRAAFRPLPLVTHSVLPRSRQSTSPIKGEDLKETHNMMAHVMRVLVLT